MSKKEFEALTKRQQVATGNRNASETLSPAAKANHTKTKEAVSEETIDLSRCIHISTLAEQVIYGPKVIAYKEKLTGRYVQVTAKQISKEEFLQLVPKENRL